MKIIKIKTLMLIIGLSLGAYTFNAAPEQSAPSKTITQQLQEKWSQSDILGRQKAQAQSENLLKNQHLLEQEIDRHYKLIFQQALSTNKDLVPQLKAMLQIFKRFLPLIKSPTLTQQDSSITTFVKKNAFGDPILMQALVLCCQVHQQLIDLIINYYSVLSQQQTTPWIFQNLQSRLEDFLRTYGEALNKTHATLLSKNVISGFLASHKDEKLAAQHVLAHLCTKLMQVITFTNNWTAQVLREQQAFFQELSKYEHNADMTDSKQLKATWSFNPNEPNKEKMHRYEKYNQLIDQAELNKFNADVKQYREGKMGRPTIINRWKNSEYRGMTTEQPPKVLLQ